MNMDQISMPSQAVESFCNKINVHCNILAVKVISDLVSAQ